MQDKVEKLEKGGGGGGGLNGWEGQRGRIPLLQQLGGMGERCKLPHRSLGRSPNIRGNLLLFFFPHVCSTYMYMYV